jgi:16S rRNA (uracil1498-N3)-methyltransferase
MTSRKAPLVVLKHGVSVGQTITPPADLVHRLRRVIRLPHGASIRGLLPGGSYAELVFRYGKGEAARLEVVDVVERKKPDRHGLTVALSLIKRASHVDFIIEKGTELGVAGWWSVETAHCADIGLMRAYQKRLARWERIVESAVLQSEQPFVPMVEGVFSWDDFLEKSAAFPFRVFGHPGAARDSHRPVWDPQRGCAIFLVGPEGGFSEREIRTLKETGFLEYRLGSSVLRAETAALVGAVLLLDAVDREMPGPVL